MVKHGNTVLFPSTSLAPCLKLPVMQTTPTLGTLAMLPPEVRRLIYSFHFEACDANREARRKKKRHDNVPALLRVSRAISIEARPIFASFYWDTVGFVVMRDSWPTIRVSSNTSLVLIQDGSDEEERVTGCFYVGQAIPRQVDVSTVNGLDLSALRRLHITIMLWLSDPYSIHCDLEDYAAIASASPKMLQQLATRFTGLRTMQIDLEYDWTPYSYKLNGIELESIIRPFLAVESLSSVQLYNVLHLGHGALISDIRGQVLWVLELNEQIQIMLGEQERRIELQTGLFGKWTEDYRMREAWFAGPDLVVIGEHA